MSRKVKLVTPKEYAEIHQVAYTTVLYWLNNGRVEGAVKHETPRGPYWELPVDTPRPKKMSGRPPLTDEEKAQRAVEKLGLPLFDQTPATRPKAKAKKSTKKGKGAK